MPSCLFLCFHFLFFVYVSTYLLLSRTTEILNLKWFRGILIPKSNLNKAWLDCGLKSSLSWDYNVMILIGLTEFYMLNMCTFYINWVCLYQLSHLNQSQPQ